MTFKKNSIIYFVVSMNYSKLFNYIPSKKYLIIYLILNNITE